MMKLQDVSYAAGSASGTAAGPDTAGGMHALRRQEGISDLRSFADVQTTQGISRLPRLAEEVARQFGKQSATALPSAVAADTSPAQVSGKPSTLARLNALHLRSSPYRSAFDASTAARDTGKEPPSDDSSSVIETSRETTPSGIERDSRGIYGFMPKPGTSYDDPEYDFTDREFAQRQHAARKPYAKRAEALKAAADAMKTAGRDPETIAVELVQRRNALKEEARRGMQEEELEVLERRNRDKYGDPVGPTIEQQLKKYGSWEGVIEGTAKSDRNINWLLGITRPRKRPAGGRMAENDAPHGRRDDPHPDSSR